MNTLGIVEASLASNNLRGKLARKLGGKSVLEWVVRQVTDCTQVSRVVVVSDDPASEHVAELVPPDVTFFSARDSDGREGDMLDAYVRVLERHPAEAVVRVGANSPFIDPVLIDRLSREAEGHPNCDYISYCLSDGRPAIHSAVGLFAEWCRAAAIAQAAGEATDPADRRHVTRFVFSHPERFAVRLVQVPQELDRDDVRLSINSEEDWEHAQTIYDALGPDRLDWRQIAGLLDHNASMRQRMAVLNRSVGQASSLSGKEL